MSRSLEQARASLPAIATRRLLRLAALALGVSTLYALGVWSAGAAGAQTREPSAVSPLGSLPPPNAPPTPPIWVPVPSSSTSRPGAAGAAQVDVVVDLNTATVEELRRLSGVGPKRAVAILELREKLGRFRRVEELLRVRGFGRKTLARLRPHLRIGEAPRVPCGSGHLEPCDEKPPKH